MWAFLAAWAVPRNALEIAAGAMGLLAAVFCVLSASNAAQETTGFWLRTRFQALLWLFAGGASILVVEWNALSWFNAVDKPHLIGLYFLWVVFGVAVTFSVGILWIIVEVVVRRSTPLRRAVATLVVRFVVDGWSAYERARDEVLADEQSAREAQGKTDAELKSGIDEDIRFTRTGGNERRVRRRISRRVRVFRGRCVLEGPDRGRSHRDHPPALLESAVDLLGGGHGDRKALAVHLVFFDVGHMQRLEGSQADVQGDFRDLDTVFPDAAKYFRSKMQSGGGRGDTAVGFRFSVDGLVSFAVLGPVRPSDVGRQGHMAQFFNGSKEIGQRRKAESALAEVTARPFSATSPTRVDPAAPDLDTIGLRLVEQRVLRLGPWQRANEFVYLNGDQQPVVVLSAAAPFAREEPQWAARRIGELRVLTWTARRQRFAVVGNARTHGLMRAADMISER